MQDPWDAISDRLSALRRTRTPLRDRGAEVFVHDDTGLREPVFCYMGQTNPIRTPVESLSGMIRDIDACLRAQGHSGEVAWLEALCGEFTGLSVSRIGELSMRHFDLEDGPVMEWFRFDRMIGSLSDRIGVWKRGVPAGAGESSPTNMPKSPRALTRTEFRLVRPLIGASGRMLGKELAAAVPLPDNSHTRALLSQLRRDGILDSMTGKGYSLVVDPASLVPESPPDMCQGEG